MKPFFSIITPTLGRESLSRCYESVDSQTFRNFEHIVQVDIPNALLANTGHPYRQLHLCGEAHRNFGNTCRHLAWERATGEYLIYLDDDNYFSHNGVLEDFMQVTGVWALFPILHYGKRFCHIPPGVDCTDTGNFLVKREHGRFPLEEPIHSDGLLVERLKKVAPYQDLTDITPVLIYAAQNCGK